MRSFVLCYNIQMDIETTIIALGYLGIFLMMIANGTISFPSSQILYIICGFFIENGSLSLALVVFFGALGNTIGCIILYEVVRFKGLHYISKWKLFPKKEIKKITVALNKKGSGFFSSANSFPP